MKTSNFKSYKESNGIAICLYPPLNWKGDVYMELAPSKSTFFEKKANKIDEAEYEKRFYNETLSKLDPQKIYNKFKDKVLLCWEPSGEFCHRRIVAKWIESNLGIEVPEWKSEDVIKPVEKANSLF
jgi:uncharacterized protein (DUF488 family)